MPTSVITTLPTCQKLPPFHAQIMSGVWNVSALMVNGDIFGRNVSVEPGYQNLRVSRLIVGTHRHSFVRLSKMATRIPPAAASPAGASGHTKR